jgi:hypothetical protein
MANLNETRRRFMTHFAGVGLGSTLAPGILWARMQDAGAKKLTVEMVADAMKLSGLEFNEADLKSMVDAANQNRSVADVVFAPDARTNLAGADQITMETIFDSVPGTLVSAITGGTGKYKNAHGQVVSHDGPDGLIDVVVHLSTP